MYKIWIHPTIWVTGKSPHSVEPAHVTWCPTVFLCSLLAALITGLAERTLILDVPFPTEVVDAASFSSWNKSATIWY